MAGGRGVFPGGRSLRAGLWPHQYYMFELFRPEQRARAQLNLLRGETKHGVFTILKDGPHKNHVFARKDRFAEACAAAGLPHARIIALLAGGVPEWKNAEPALPRIDLFVKPAQARGGRGAEHWRWTGAGFENNAGARDAGGPAGAPVRAARTPCRHAMPDQPSRPRRTGIGRAVDPARGDLPRRAGTPGTGRRRLALRPRRRCDRRQLPRRRPVRDAYPRWRRRHGLPGE